jgi:hypothetical protein
MIRLERDAKKWAPVFRNKSRENKESWSGMRFNPIASRSSGSFFLVEVADSAAAQAMIDGDPFARDGIFAQIEVSATRLTLGGWRPTD